MRNSFLPIKLGLAGLLLVNVAACTSGPSSATDIRSLGDTISMERARKYVKNYARDKADSRDPALLDDTRCIWFSVDRLKALTQALEKEKGDGIRFYLAAYDSTYNDAHGIVPDKEYWGHTTLVMVSTKEGTDSAGNRIHQDYYSTPKRNTIVMFVPENRGEMCPPPSVCDGADLLNNDDPNQ